MSKHPQVPLSKHPISTVLNSIKDTVLPHLRSDDDRKTTVKALAHVISVIMLHTWTIGLCTAMTFTSDVVSWQNAKYVLHGVTHSTTAIAYVLHAFLEEPTISYGLLCLYWDLLPLCFFTTAILFINHEIPIIVGFLVLVAQYGVYYQCTLPAANCGQLLEWWSTVLHKLHPARARPKSGEPATDTKMDEKCEKCQKFDDEILVHEQNFDENATQLSAIVDQIRPELDQIEGEIDEIQLHIKEENFNENRRNIVNRSKNDSTNNPQMCNFNEYYGGGISSELGPADSARALLNSTVQRKMVVRTLVTSLILVGGFTGFHLPFCLGLLLTLAPIFILTHRPELPWHRPRVCDFRDSAEITAVLAAFYFWLWARLTQ